MARKNSLFADPISLTVSTGPDIAPPADAEAPPPVPELAGSPPAGPIPLADAPAGEAKPKRSHQRRTKAQIEADAAAELAAQNAPPVVSPEDLARTEQAFAVTFRAISGGLAKARGAHWALTDEEARTLGQVWGAAVAPYLHKVGPAVPWVSAAVVTWTIFQPRVEADQQAAKLKSGAAPIPPSDGQPAKPADVPPIFGR
jgi:hypothetical protein